MLQSKLNSWSVIGIAFCNLLLVATLISFSLILFSKISLFVSIPITIFIVFFIVWLVYGELRTKAVKLHFSDNNLNVRGFAGLGRQTSYLLSEFEGYKTAILPSQDLEYEYLYLMLDDKKKVKISEFYHRNYAEMKHYISQRTRNLGVEKFEFVKEIKEVFIS